MTLVGIISDSHDNLDSIKEAVEFLNRECIEVLIHAGDLISPFTIPLFSEFEGEKYFVFGNNDGEKGGLSKKIEEIGGSISNLLNLELYGKRFIVYHGTDSTILDTIKNCSKYDFIVTGHTHESNIEPGNPTLINPGELCGYLSGKRTLCILDENMHPEIVEI